MHCYIEFTLNINVENFNYNKAQGIKSSYHDAAKGIFYQSLTKLFIKYTKPF